MDLRNQQGQTVVEYILLLAVAVSLVLTFFNSAAYRRLFGSQGSVGMRIKSESEFAYRHAFVKPGAPDIARDNKDGSIHPSYYDADNNSTRFFGPREGYE